MDVVVAIPLGSILGSLLFNILLCDIYFFCNDIDFANYANDNTSYCIGKTPETVTLSQLEKSSKSIFELLENKGMKASLNKCHFLLSKNENFKANINKNWNKNWNF